MDMISELAELALASRLKRLAERLQRDVSGLYKELEVDFEPRWFTVTYALARQSPMSVGELAIALGVTHPAVLQAVNEMTQKGLIETSKDPRDDRRRLVQLSSLGSETAAALAPVWQAVQDATRSLLRMADQNLLSGLEAMEQELSRESVAARARRQLASDPHPAIEILEYRQEWKSHFRRLNEEWLTGEFHLEAVDEQILGDPEGEVLERGGAILFARVHAAIVGTCALLPLGGGDWELAKMAVRSSTRRRGVGRALTHAALDRVRERGGQSLHLATSPLLEPALALYRQLGFRETAQSPIDLSAFERDSLTMRLDLQAS